MQKIEPPDSHFLSAAIGWLELGNAGEARVELASLSEGVQRHPAVLETYWQVHAQCGEWERALQVARDLLTVDPANCSGWIHQAYALRRAPGGGLEAAQLALRPARDKFPSEFIVPYNLACYAAQLGNMDEAWERLQQAMALAGKKMIKTMALADADLEQLWPRLI
jgi:predicted Zn-dependent protease